MKEKFRPTPEQLRSEYAVRKKPLDHLYSLEGGISLREEIDSLQEAFEAGSTESLFLDRILKGPVAYLEMPDRYDLDKLQKDVSPEEERMTNEEFRAYRTQLEKEDPEVHALFENQRVRVNNFQAALLPPLVFAQVKNIGDQKDLEALLSRYESVANSLRAKELPQEVDHRTMSDEQKDAVVQDASRLALDEILFALQALSPRLE